MKIESPYKRGAVQGLPLGIMLCVMFFASVFSGSVPLLSVVALVIFVSVPVFVYRSLRRTYVMDHGLTTFSSLWMQGIMTFGCGSLLMALASTIYMKWINPMFLINSVNQAIDFYSSLPDQSSAQVADLLSRMVEANAVPTAAYISLEMVWLSIFTGSLVSLALAAIARSRAVPPAVPRGF